MDNFQYALRIKEIDTFKTLKAKEEFIREMEKLITDNSWGNIKVEDNPQSYQNIFKCITKCNKVYTRELPEFINRSIISGHTDLMHYYMEKTTNASYETIIDTFQYVAEVQMPATAMNKLKRLSVIYGDNPMTFTFKHYTVLNASFSSMFARVGTTPNKSADIFQIEEIKRSLPAAIRYTIIEDMLDSLYTETSKNPDFILKVLESTRNMVTVANTYRDKMHG